MTPITRRKFISSLARTAVIAGSVRPFADKLFALENKSTIRRFHICLQPQAIKEFPQLPSLIREAGVTDVWLAGFFYGQWYLKPDELRAHADYLIGQGFHPHIINLPLGHPGASIGLNESHNLNTPPAHWKNAQSFTEKSATCWNCWATCWTTPSNTAKAKCVLPAAP